MLFSLQATKLRDLSSRYDFPTSVQWAEQRADHLAIGSARGSVEIWDVAARRRIRDLRGLFTSHDHICSLAWNGDIICSGSSDGFILMRDSREPPVAAVSRLVGHRLDVRNTLLYLTRVVRLSCFNLFHLQVCGLRWSPDQELLASGGADNRLLVWSVRNLRQPLLKFNHKATVKALAWSPRDRSLLASGGGLPDCTIRFWNTQTGQRMQSIDTKSQVTNIVWSKLTNELVKETYLLGYVCLGNRKLSVSA